MGRTFDELVDEAQAAPVDGWDFSWLDGRASEERPPWGYARLMGERLAGARVALDLQTGGGEVLATAPRLAPVTVATEGWPPNLARAVATLRPRGVSVVADRVEPPLPFVDEAFDLVVSRHPVRVCWPEVARVLRRGGTLLSQQIGPANLVELAEYFLGPRRREAPRTDRTRAAVRDAGLEVVDLRLARLRVEFHDIGAVIWFLRKVIWIVPGFTVAAHRERLRRLHELIEARGPFRAHATRILVVATKR